MVKKLTEVHKMPRYLLIYYEISFANIKATKTAKKIGQMIPASPLIIYDWMYGKASFL